MQTIVRGFRNAFRNGMRASAIIVIIGLTIALSLSMLVAHQAVGQRIADVQQSVGNTITISPAGIRGFDGGGNALTTSQLAAVQKLAHVSSLTESLNDRLTSSDTNLKSAVDLGKLGQRFVQRTGGNFGFGTRFDAGSFTPPVTVIGTTDPTDLAATQGGGTFSLKSGKLIDAGGTDNIALVGATLASKNGLKVGSTFTAYGKTVTVSGIFDAGNAFSDNLIVMPLKTVQKLSDQQNAITGAVATVDSITNLDATTTAIKDKLGTSADVTSSTDRTQDIIAPLQNVQTISLYSLVGAVAAGAIIVLLTMVMIVRERRREIGILKAIGASNRLVVEQFVAEAMTFTIFGAVVGIIGGIVAANPITQLLVTNGSSSPAPATTIGGGPGGFITREFTRGIGGVGQSLQTIHAAAGWDVVAYGLGAALILAVIGSAAAAYVSTRVRPAEVMRTE